MCDGVMTRLVVNGQPVSVKAPAGARLSDVLRDELGLSGAKEACGRGDCGACTVLVGDRAVPSCLVLAARVADPVRTVEGLAAEATRLREALADFGGLQCGYCTPGLVVRAHRMLSDGECEGISRDAIRQALAGNLCRCTGYDGIITALAQAIKAAAP